jgi:hypothetical protein
MVAEPSGPGDLVRVKEALCNPRMVWERSEVFGFGGDHRSEWGLHFHQLGSIHIDASIR